MSDQCGGITNLTEDRAIALIELMRWHGRAQCPHCDCQDAYRLTAKPSSKRPCRKGLWKCSACRKQFTVRVGTIFEGSHIPLRKWLGAFLIVCKGKQCSARQIGRMLKMSYKSAWLVTRRVHFALAHKSITNRRDWRKTLKQIK